MAYRHDDVIKAKSEQLQADYAEANAQYESARVSEDGHGVMAASDRMLEIEHKMNSLGRIAQTYVASQQQPVQRPFGLSDQELEIARNSHSNGTPDERVAEYAKNKNKLQNMRASGQYRDDQGSVRR